MKTVLDSRLSAAAELVREGAVVADIGTDHGYLVSYLVGGGKCPSGFACDIAQGPVSRAMSTVERCGLSDRIEVLRADGLEGITGRNVDDIVICGMGGELISDILEASPWAKNSRYSFVLGPMTKAERLRGYLYCSGFNIDKEVAVIDGRFVYTVMRAIYTGVSLKASPLEMWTGKIWDNNDDASLQYLDRLRGRLAKAHAGKPSEETAELIARITERISSCTR